MKGHFSVLEIAHHVYQLINILAIKQHGTVLCTCTSMLANEGGGIITCCLLCPGTVADVQIGKTCSLCRNDVSYALHDLAVV